MSMFFFITANDMSNLPPDTDTDHVYYCKSCHSLCVVIDESLSSSDWDGSYCGDCYSTDIGLIPFEEWLEEEERRKKQKEIIEWNK